MKTLILCGTCVLTLGLAACDRMPGANAKRLAAEAASAPIAAAPVTALVALAPTKGSKVSGTLTVVYEKGVVTLTGQVAGLTAGGKHGFHVHEKGNCSAPDASSAGGHFNPGGMAHGDPNSAVHHLGDMLNIEGDATGTAQVNVKLAGVTLKDGGPTDLRGKSIVVHAEPDDYMTQPAGNSGNRVACGVIA